MMHAPFSTKPVIKVATIFLNPIVSIGWMFSVDFNALNGHRESIFL